MGREEKGKRERERLRKSATPKGVSNPSIGSIKGLQALSTQALYSPFPLPVSQQKTTI